MIKYNHLIQISKCGLLFYLCPAFSNDLFCNYDDTRRSFHVLLDYNVRHYEFVCEVGAEYSCYRDSVLQVSSITYFESFNS